MLQAFKTYASGWKIKTEKGDRTYDGIQVRVRPTSSGENEYLIGNGSLNDYEIRDPDYGAKILKHIMAANQTMDRSTNQFFLSDYKGVEPISLNPATEIILTQKQFDAFSGSASPAKAEPNAKPKAKPKAEPELDPKRIVVNVSGVQFKGTPQSWNNGKCMFNKDTTPFAKVDFVRADRSVRVKFTLPSMDKVAYCALAQYGDHDGNVYDLLSPSATIALTPTVRESNEDNWDITLHIDALFVKFRQYFKHCESGTGFNEHAYTFYEERNPLISTLFFTKPTEVESTPEQLLRLNNNRLAQATKIIDAQPDSVLSDTEKEVLNALIKNFSRRLSENSSNIDELNKLDKEIILFVRVEITELLLQAQKAAMTGVDALTAQMRRVTPMGGVARPPSSSSGRQ